MDDYGNPNLEFLCERNSENDVLNADDCDDEDILENPDATWYTDEDGDGFGVGDASECQRTQLMTLYIIQIVMIMTTYIHKRIQFAMMLITIVMILLILMMILMDIQMQVVEVGIVMTAISMHFQRSMVDVQWEHLVKTF